MDFTPVMGVELKKKKNYQQGFSPLKEEFSCSLQKKKPKMKYEDKFPVAGLKPEWGTWQEIQVASENKKRWDPEL